MFICFLNLEKKEQSEISYDFYIYSLVSDDFCCLLALENKNKKKNLPKKLRYKFPYCDLKKVS